MIKTTTIKMEVQEDKPLQTNNKIVGTTITINCNKNNIGRPKKSCEIKFSPQPKSIISLLLSKEQKIVNKPICRSPTELCTDSTERKKWNCEKCSDGILYNEEEFNNHMLSHSQHYKCNYDRCKYSTKLLSNLKTHKRTHTLERPYACDECVFRSNFISSLKTHKRLHSQERPFACQHCDYKCNSSSNLKKHCSRKHSKSIKN